VTRPDGILDGRQRWVATPSEAITKAILDHRHNEETLRRFFEKVDYGFEGPDCWIWFGTLSDEGYGDFRLSGRTVRAHRVAYLWRFGVIPSDRPFLDHVDCIGRFCVNPHHLEPIDNTENTIRGRGIGAAQQRTLRSMELALRDERRAAGEEGIF
jgi:hypothetical protein